MRALYLGFVVKLAAFGMAENRVSVAVDGGGPSERREVLAQQFEIPVSRLDEFESSGEDSAGRIVVGQQQAAARSSFFKPRMR
jgi:hypothetical protein